MIHQNSLFGVREKSRRRPYKNHAHRIGAFFFSICGKSTMAHLSAYIQKQQPEIKGFSPQNLWRMHQFFEVYRGEPKLSTLLRELPWSANLHILSRAKRPEDCEFYLHMAVQNHLDAWEVARQIDAAFFKRAVINPPQVSTALRELRPGADHL